VFNILDSYYLVLGLQGVCLYHAYQNNTQQRWYWIILFLPVIGSLIYLYDNFYSRRNISNVSEGMKGMFNGNHKIEQLEKTLKFSDTYNNKINLADAYIEKQRFEEAITIYESCRSGIYENNPELIEKLSNAYFLSNNFKKLVALHQKQEPVGESLINYAWALHYVGDSLKAEEKFKGLNRRFSNFQGRIEYAKFLLEKKRNDEAQHLLLDILEEYDSMTSYEKNLKKGINSEAKRLLRTIK
jgi:hypothetical protein